MNKSNSTLLGRLAVIALTSFIAACEAPPEEDASYAAYGAAGGRRQIDEGRENSRERPRDKPDSDRRGSAEGRLEEDPPSPPINAGANVPAEWPELRAWIDAARPAVPTR